MLIINPTGINDSHQGERIGKALFKYMVEQVRSEGRKVMPLCPFTRAMFERNRSNWDILRNNSL